MSTIGVSSSKMLDCHGRAVLSGSTLDELLGTDVSDDHRDSQLSAYLQQMEISVSPFRAHGRVSR
jgi:hypothetical protein